MNKLLKRLCIVEIVLAVLVGIMSLFINSTIALKIMIITSLIIIILEQLETLRRNK